MLEKILSEVLLHSLHTCAVCVLVYLGIVSYSISCLQGIYKQSIWLALVVFGVPLVVIGIVCYALCCMDPVDENTEMTYNSDDEDDPTPLRDPGNKSQ